MLKKISVDHLRLGMYLEQFCCSWLDHPFWRSRFVLSDPQDLARIRESVVREVWINTDKGLDIAVNEAFEPADEETAQRVTRRNSSGVPPVKPVEMAEEMRLAARLLAKSRVVVFAMFEEVRADGKLDVSQAQPLVDEINASISRNSGALIGLMRLKSDDTYAYTHSVAVAALMVLLARQLELDEDQVREAGLAGLFHDLGKVRIPNALLNKRTKLTPDEMILVRTHVLEGYQLLQSMEGIGQFALDVCLHHHEKVDGSGYPDHLAGDQLSLAAKMAKICDAYDTIASDKPYRPGLDPGDALKHMATLVNHEFDERVFQAFVKSLGVYPIGSLVRLESGRLGVVLEQNRKYLLQPVVKVFFSTKAQAHILPEIIDLSRPGCHDKIVGVESRTKWGIRNVDQFWAVDSPR